MQTIKIPEILLPQTEDMTAWSVNACDQYTSDYGYWQSLALQVTGKPSTFHMIYPEIYLNDNTQARIDSINATMQNYLESGRFKKIHGGFILVERTTQSGTRTGIVLAIDLEDYSFGAGAQTLVRSTEATIASRIPPRVCIRENAPIELPHVMLLYDDKSNAVLSSVQRGATLYDFDLNMGGGHVKGTYITNAQEVVTAFEQLSAQSTEKYASSSPFLFAVGDGNHSLAAAKTCWNNIKATLSEEEQATHPARYALVEAVNLHDPALKFEPIHRLVKTDKPDLFVHGLKTEGENKAVLAVNGKYAALHFPADIPAGIRKLDDYIAQFIEKNGGEVDYIHGNKELAALSSQGVGIMLPAIEKDDFFRLIANGGNLPRKTFSMGEGNEKRYYLEAKAIR